MNIVPMRWWDIESLLQTESELFGDTAWSAGQFWSELAHVPDTRRYVVARDDDGALLGYAGVYVMKPTADVQTIAVAKHAQRRGVGGALLEALQLAAREHGCTEMMLEVRAENESAIGLYRSRGFEQLAVRRGYYGPGEDALIMRLRPV